VSFRSRNTVIDALLAYNAPLHIMAPAQRKRSRTSRKMSRCCQKRKFPAHLCLLPIPKLRPCARERRPLCPDDAKGQGKRGKTWHCWACALLSPQKRSPRSGEGQRDGQKYPAQKMGSTALTAMTKTLIKQSKFLAEQSIPAPLWSTQQMMPVLLLSP
jgi:hypothetical protein